MEPREQQPVLILAGIGGYTKFMVENQLAAVHGQLCITFFIEAILHEVDIPLQVYRSRFSTCSWFPGVARAASNPGASGSRG